MASEKKGEENFDDIKEALEFQIDIVLKLEEERLILIRDNKIQKQHIKELEDMLTRMSHQLDLPTKPKAATRDFETQASIQLYSFGVDTGVQTEAAHANLEDCISDRDGFDDDLSDSELQYSQNQSIITVEEDFEGLHREQDTLVSAATAAVTSKGSSNKASELFQQAQMMLKKSEAKLESLDQQTKKKPMGTRTAATGPVKNLKFKSKETPSQPATTNRTMNTTPASHMSSTHSQMSSTTGLEKENASFSQNSERRGKDQSEVIASELIKVTRENNTMKKEMQKMVELSKKQTKESTEMKKMMDVKNEMLEKLRVEVAELSLVLNNDKFKSVRTIESDAKKWKQNCMDMRKEFDKVMEERNEYREEVSQFKGILNKLSAEYDRLSSNSHSGDAMLKQESESLRQRVTELEHQEKFRREQMTIKEAIVQESALEKAKILEELEYYKQVSIKSKQYAHKAIQDIDYYRNILKQHNIPLA